MHVSKNDTWVNDAYKRNGERSINKGYISSDFHSQFGGFYKNRCLFDLSPHRCKTITSKVECLTSETIKGSTLSLESVDYIKSGDSLSSGVLSVGDSISDDVFKEDLKDTTGLFVDKTRDTLDTTSSCQSSDGRLGDTLDVISQDLSVTLGTTLT